MTNGRLIDMTGQTFGRLTVHVFAYRKGTATYWHCRCVCGRGKDIRRAHLLRGAVRSCGCIAAELLIDRTGQTFSRLTVIERRGSKHNARYWMCRCQCGKDVVVKGSHLLTGGVRSCGCLRDEELSRRSMTHGQCRGGIRTKEYKQQEFLKYRKKLEAMHGADWWRHSAQCLYALKHPEWVRSQRKRYRQKHKASILAATRARQALQLRAMPLWANKKAIKAFYVEAKRLTEVTGVPHEVDHIIPLRGKRVWGFHVEGNLQILTATKNRQKHNKVAV